MMINKQAKRDAKQLFRLCLVNGSLDDNRVRQVVEQAVAARDRDSPAILAHFLRLVKLDRLQHAVNVESVAPLPVELQSRLQADLTRLYGCGLTTAFECNPSLIGGVCIRVGSNLYDGSVRAKLRALEESF
jgi:F-type H+-transporting ATPase subunit delta